MFPSSAWPPESTFGSQLQNICSVPDLIGSWPTCRVHYLDKDLRIFMQTLSFFSAQLSLSSLLFPTPPIPGITRTPTLPHPTGHTTYMKGRPGRARELRSIKGIFWLPVPQGLSRWISSPWAPYLLPPRVSLYQNDYVAIPDRTIILSLFGHSGYPSSPTGEKQATKKETVGETRVIL